MRRNIDLVREIMLAIEASPDDEPASIRLDHRTYNDIMLSHHVHALHEAGLVHAIESHRSDSSVWVPHSLTWAGHEFLVLVRDNTTWQELKQAAGAQNDDVSFEIIKALALQKARQRVGLLKD